MLSHLATANRLFLAGNKFQNDIIFFLFFLKVLLIFELLLAVLSQLLWFALLML